MKKLFACLFVATALFLLVGCNWGGGTTEENPFQTIQGNRFDPVASRMIDFNINFNDITSTTPILPAYAHGHLLFDAKNDISLNINSISFNVIPKCDMIISHRIFNGRGFANPVSDWTTVVLESGISQTIIVPASFSFDDRIMISFSFLINENDEERHSVADMYLWKQNGRNGEEVPGLPMDGKSFIFQLYNFDFITA